MQDYEREIRENSLIISYQLEGGIFGALIGLAILPASLTFVDNNFGHYPMTTALCTVPLCGFIGGMIGDYHAHRTIDLLALGAHIEV